MTLLELLNLSSSIFMFPNNDGQPGAFPAPSFGDYLSDWGHYLSTHMPYVDDAHQTGIRRYLVAEAAFIYFFLVVALRRFRVAQIYLLAKLVTFVLLFLTSGLSYWNLLAWALCFLVYPLELLVLFIFSTWFFHRHGVKKINRKTGRYRVDREYRVLKWEKGRFHWEKRKEFFAIVGLFTFDRQCYQAAFMLVYIVAKFKMILGNPLAYFYKLWVDSDIDNTDLIGGIDYEEEFGFVNHYTTARMDRLYHTTARKYPILQEFHRRGDAYDQRVGDCSKKISIEQSHRDFVNLVHSPLTIFGIEVPWVVEEERTRKATVERWLPEVDPDSSRWVTVDAAWTYATPLEKRTGPVGVADYFNRKKITKLNPWKLPSSDLSAPAIKKAVPAQKLSQRIIDNLSTEHFAATTETILNPESGLYSQLTSTKRHGFRSRLELPQWRFRPRRKSTESAKYDVIHPDGSLWYYTYNRARLDETGWQPGYVPQARRYSWHPYQPTRVGQLHRRPRHTWVQGDRAPASPYKKFEFVGPAGMHPIWTPAKSSWKRVNVEPEIRTGFTGFNFEQFAPLMELDSISNLRYGLLFILALSSLTVYSIILAGWSSNSKYAFLGALRSAAQMISYEVSISLALLPVILLSGSLNLTAIVYGQIGTVWYLFPLLPIALVFLVSMLAETNRTPFDLPEAEAELVAGYNVDYSSLPFAMFFLGEYSNMILISVLFCLLFLGGWDGAITALQEPYVLTLKAAFVWVFFVIVRATLPRYRYDQLMDIGWKAFLPFAGSFLVFVIGLVVLLDVAPVVEEVVLEDLYGAPTPFLAELPVTICLSLTAYPTAAPSKTSPPPHLVTYPPMLSRSNNKSTLTLSQTKGFVAQRHPFHILETSPFPFLTGFFLLTLLMPLTFSLHGVDLLGLPRAEVIHASFFGLFLTAMTWFTSIILESSQGYHTKKVQEGLRMGMLLFILSEVMLFFAFFWGFFHVSLVPAVSIGNVWPPTDTQPLDMWGLPLVNTLLLLTSGVTITLGHAELVKGNTAAFFWQLFLTILLGTVFLFCQAYEYQYGVLFSFRDNIYGSIFFITTGFHGMHVTIGTLFLLYCATRHLLTAKEFGDRSRAIFSFTPGHHFGFEAAAWYWHFVDVVWLFLFLSIYWWGGK